MKKKELIKLVRASDNSVKEVTKSEVKHLLTLGYRHEVKGTIEVKAKVKQIKKTDETKEGKQNKDS